MSWSELDEFLWARMPVPLEEAEAIPLSPSGLIEIFWLLNEVFRPVHARVRSLPYRTMFEAGAEEAIVRFAWNPTPEAWGDLKPGVWRVLLERHEQMLMVCMGNAAEGEPRMTFIPKELPDSDRLPAQMLEWHLRMSLPWRPQDRSRDEARGAASAPSLRRQ